MEFKLLKFQAARAILDVDFTVPLETMITQLKWMTFPERVVYHKAIQTCIHVSDVVIQKHAYMSQML